MENVPYKIWYDMNEVTADGHKGYVIFDTNIVEKSFLVPLLKGGDCQQVSAILDKGYRPAITTKTLYEIWTHAKYGKGSPVWQRRELGHPGNINDIEQRTVKPLLKLLGTSPDLASHYLQFLGVLVSPSEVSSLDPRFLSFLLFSELESLSYGVDWNEWFASLTENNFMNRNFLEKIVSYEKEFSFWRDRLGEFCDNLESILQASGIEILNQHQIQYQDTISGKYAPMHMSLVEREIAQNSLVPHEDLDIVVTCFVTNTRALVSEENDISYRLAVSLGFQQVKGVPNLNPVAFVHPDYFEEALQQDFSGLLYSLPNRKNQR